MLEPVSGAGTRGQLGLLPAWWPLRAWTRCTCCWQGPGWVWAQCRRLQLLQGTRWPGQGEGGVHAGEPRNAVQWCGDTWQGHTLSAAETLGLTPPVEGELRDSQRPGWALVAAARPGQLRWPDPGEGEGLSSPGPWCRTGLEGGGRAGSRGCGRRWPCLLWGRGQVLCGRHWPVGVTVQSNEVGPMSWLLRTRAVGWD